jgi:hypothetical protein
VLQDRVGSFGTVKVRDILNRPRQLFSIDYSVVATKSRQEKSLLNGDRTVFVLR